MVSKTDNFVVLNLAAEPAGPAYPKISKDSRGWTKWGDRNTFPQEVMAANIDSPINGAILDSKVTYICGKGIKDVAADAAAYVGEPHTGGRWDEVLRRLAVDYVNFGGFCFQVILNNDSDTVSLFHQDFSEVRLGALDDRGRALGYFIAKDWTKTSGKTAPTPIAKWEGVEKAEKGKPYLHYYFDYQPGLRYYPLPSYYKAREYIKADGLLANFYTNSIMNGFTPSVVVTMPSNPSDREKEEFQRGLESKFAGVPGASRVVVVWGEDKGLRPLIEPFSSSANIDVYNNVEGIIFQKIISAHRLPSPTLAGVSGSGNLSGNAQEIIDAFILFNYTVIEGLRTSLLDQLNIFTKINGVGLLEVSELDVVSKISESRSGEKIITIQDGKGGVPQRLRALRRSSE